MIGDTGQQGDDGAGLGKDHLFERRVDFAPGGRLLEGGAAARPVADIGDGNLDGVFVHLDHMTENFRTNHGVLGEIFRHAAPDHQQARCPGLDLDVGEFAEVTDGIDGEMAFRVAVLMKDQPKTGAGIGEGRAKHRHAVLVRRLHQRVRLAGLAGGKIGPHGLNELARRMRPGRETVGNFANDRVAGLKVFFVNVGVIDPIDEVASQIPVINIRRALEMTKPQGLEKIHVNDAGAGGDNSVNHVVFDQVGIDLHTSSRRCGAGQGQDDRTGLITKHGVVYFRRSRQIARGERHFRHAVDNRAGIDGRHVHVLDRRAQQFCLFVLGF